MVDFPPSGTGQKPRIEVLFDKIKELAELYELVKVQNKILEEELLILKTNHLTLKTDYGGLSSRCDSLKEEYHEYLRQTEETITSAYESLFEGELPPTLDGKLTQYVTKVQKYVSETYPFGPV